MLSAAHPLGDGSSLAELAVAGIELADSDLDNTGFDSGALDSLTDLAQHAIRDLGG